jgi:hypothetical protein
MNKEQVRKELLYDLINNDFKFFDSHFKRHIRNKINHYFGLRKEKN